MKKSLRKRLVSSVLIIALMITAFPAAAFAAEVDAGALARIEENAVSEEVEELEETLCLEEAASEENAIPEESTEDSTVFDLGDGEKMVIYHGQNVRFEDEDGTLTDYDPELTEITSEKSETGENLSGYSYENRAGDKKQYIPESLSDETPVLMENGEYSIKMAPISDTFTEKVKIESEAEVTAYEEVEAKDVTAVYESEDGKHRYEYTSLNEGIKENIILEECPENNVFKFNLNLKGMTAELNEKENTVLLKDKVSGEVKTVIEKPFMNDRSEEAYSEDLKYSLKEGSEDGEYTLILAVSKEYLEDEERLYPVTIDPTATWIEEDEFIDAYVISGTTYGDINFCDSGVKVMTAGKDGNGHTHQTFIKLPNIKANLEDKYVHSAYLTVYETAKCKANQKIRLNRVIESWTSTTITWNTKPEYASTYINNFTTSGKTYASHKIKMTNTVRNYLNETNNPNYGIVMRNITESPTYAEFFGSRTSASAYRPKLVVTYYDKPTAPSSVTTSRIKDGEYVQRQYMKKGDRVYVSWDGIESKNLANVQYKIIAGDDETPDPTSISSDGVDLTSYRTLNIATSSAANVSVPYSISLPAGKYRIYIRGKDAGGMYGAAKYRTFYVDDNTPALTASISPSDTSSSNPSNNAQPVITYSASDTYLDKVTISIDGGDEEEITGGTYTVGEEVIETDGSHTITVKAYDKSGKSSSKTFTYYYKNAGSVVPHTFAVSESYGKRIITWKLAKYDSENYAYDLHRSTTSNFTPTSSNRVAKDINAGLKYYADKTILSEKTYYYKIVVRARDTSSNIEDQVTSQISFANTTTLDDFTNDTGFKDYLPYFEFGTPTGTGYIEKSSGNLMYSQDDFNVSNSQLSYGLSRTYNSKNEFTGMFGKGWSDSYHKELYLKSGDAYIAGGDGSVLTFVEQDDGSFICDETKEFTLVENSDKSYTMTSKDMTVYKFTRYGQLEYTEEPNGCKITNTYDRYGRLKKVTTVPDGNTLEFTYASGSNKLTSVKELNGNVYSFSYSGDTLTGLTVTDGSSSENTVTYSYGYTSEGLLNKIYDGEGNCYQAAYSSGKANLITYPNSETYSLTYGSGNTAVTKKNENGSTVYTESVTFDTSTGKVLTVTDAKGRVTEYTYDSTHPYLVSTEEKDFYYQKLNGNTVSLNEKLIETTTYLYDENENLEKVTTSYSAPSGVTIAESELPDTVITVSEYNEDNLLTSEVTTSKDRATNEVVTLDNVSYSYDEKRNIEKTVDNIEKTTEIYVHDESGNQTDSKSYNQVLTDSQVNTELTAIANVLFSKLNKPIFCKLI